MLSIYWTGFAITWILIFFITNDMFGNRDFWTAIFCAVVIASVWPLYIGFGYYKAIRLAGIRLYRNMMDWRD